MKKRIWLLLLTLAVVAAACGGGTESTTTAAAGGDASTTAAPSGGGETITIVANAWTASALNAEIAKQLIESELGHDVEIVAIDENTMFTGLSDGSLDAVLELWPSGISADEQAFLDDGSVVNVGELGVVGQIGWFVPQYVIDENPELATWEGFLDPELAALFATAETGELGRFLATDPSYSQYDEPIVANLELPLQVVYSGSEPATVAELDARVAASEPIVMYWWTPTAAVAKYDLVQVELPEYSDECYADPAAVDCAYPSDVLIKLASAQLEAKAPDVLTFISNFQLTNEDQLSMLPAVEIDGEDAADIAAQWIADNETVWSTWLP
jgi:glycine betaine/proline transport system substrate-binding protein